MLNWQNDIDMAISDNIGWIATLVGTLGGWELIKWLLNRDANKRIGAAEAFEAEYKAMIEDYHRVQKEVDDAKAEIRQLNAKVDELYKQVHRLEGERLDLIKENNELRLALKEAEKHVCMQPDDNCLKRLGTEVNCRLRDLLRGKYAEDHPGAILTDDDMRNVKQPKDKGNEEGNKGNEEQ